MLNIKNCPFCNEISGINSQYSNLVKENTGLPGNRILHVGKHWFIVPSIGAIAPGYLLFVSKRHHLSVAECEIEEIVELEGLINITRDFLEKAYQLPCVLFEHGGTENLECSPASVDHCHIHIVPFEGDLMVADDNRKIIPIGRLCDIGRYVKFPQSYLFYQSNQRENYLILRDEYPSQYFRKILASQLREKERWDWRSSPLLPTFIETYDFLKKLKFEEAFK